MNRSITLLACASVLLCCAEAFGASWNTVVFRHDFDTSVGDPPDPSVWVVNHPDEWWWVQGRTHFPDPLSTTGPFPRVDEEGGTRFCVIEHHHYNPWDLGTPNTTFLGGEIHTIQEFEPNTGYRIEARVRSPAYPDGLVTSFFEYGFDGAKSDEIDFEFVSNQTNDDVTYPNGDPVLTNIWNESSSTALVQEPQYVAPSGLDLTQWNTFRIYWHPTLGRADWSWVDSIEGETWLRSETDPSCIPDEPMALYFNFWAPLPSSPIGTPCSPPFDWDAYDAGLQPVNDSGSDQTSLYEIDYAEARTLSENVPAVSKALRVAMAALILASGGLLVRLRQGSRSRRRGLPVS